MSTFGNAIVIGGALCMAEFGFACVAGPYSKEWGLNAYVITGLIMLLVLLILPFALRTPESILLRVLLSSGFAVIGAGIWFLGLLVNDFRLITRLI